MQLLTVSVLLLSCGGSTKEEGKSQPQQSQESEADQSQESVSSGEEGDVYRIIFRKIDNKVLLHVEDSLIYDSGTIAGNPDLEVEIFLTEYVEAGKIEIRVDGYNGVEPYNQADSHWEIVYDIFKNDEIIEFVREASDRGEVGKVFEEFHYLDELD